MTISTTTDHAVATRRRWMALLAKAGEQELEAAWEALADRPGHVFVRAPESGMTMVRGRAGGTGAPFNLGEMTVTRCALRLADGTMGVAYVKGRSHRHAELAALFDALLQDPARRDEVTQDVILPLERAAHERAEAARRRTAATRVDFFTMATGRDGT